MYKYFVETYAMKTNRQRRIDTIKADDQLTNHLNEMSQKGWEIISIANYDAESDDFLYKIVYRFEYTNNTEIKNPYESLERFEKTINSDEAPTKEIAREQNVEKYRIISTNDLDFINGKLNYKDCSYNLSFVQNVKIYNNSVIFTLFSKKYKVNCNSKFGVNAIYLSLTKYIGNNDD